MHRTQLNLDEWLYERLRSVAEQRGESISAVARRVLGEHFRRGDGRRRRKTYEETLGTIEGIAHGGGRSWSEDVDEIYDED